MAEIIIKLFQTNGYTFQESKIACLSFKFRSYLKDKFATIAADFFSLVQIPMKGLSRPWKQ